MQEKVWVSSWYFGFLLSCCKPSSRIGYSHDPQKHWEQLLNVQDIMELSLTAGIVVLGILPLCCWQKLFVIRSSWAWRSDKNDVKGLIFMEKFSSGVIISVRICHTRTVAREILICFFCFVLHNSGWKHKVGCLLELPLAKGNLGVCKGFIVTFWNCPGFCLKGSKLLVILMWKRVKILVNFFPNKHCWKLNCWPRLSFIRSQRKFQITQCLYWA